MQSLAARSLSFSWLARVLPLCALCLSGCVSSQVHAQLSDSPTCRIVQKPRVYVGLSGEVGLDLYEAAAAIAKQILRAVQSGLCARLATPRRRLLPDSLRSALGGGRRVLIDSVQFSDASLQRAYVLLRAELAGERAWRVWLRSERGWQIERVLEELVLGSPPRSSARSSSPALR